MTSRSLSSSPLKSVIFFSSPFEVYFFSFFSFFLLVFRTAGMEERKTQFRTRPNCPTNLFTILESTKSVDCWSLSCAETSINGFWGSNIVEKIGRVPARSWPAFFDTWLLGREMTNFHARMTLSEADWGRSSENHAASVPCSAADFVHCSSVKTNSASSLQFGFCWYLFERWRSIKCSMIVSLYSFSFFSFPDCLRRSRAGLINHTEGENREGERASLT